MRRLVLVAAVIAVAAALLALLRRRTAPSPQPVSTSRDPMPVQREPPVDPDRPGVAPDPEAREQESAVTRETRFDRLADEEREARRDAIRRLQADPLSERLAGGEPAED